MLHTMENPAIVDASGVQDCQHSPPDMSHEQRPVQDLVDENAPQESGDPELQATYTLVEAAEALGIHLRTLERWLRAAHITSHRDAENARKRYITADEFQKLKQQLSMGSRWRQAEEDATEQQAKSGSLQWRSPPAAERDRATRRQRMDRNEQLRQIQALRQDVESVSRELADLRAVVATLTSEVGLGLKEVAKTLTQTHLERQQEQGHGRGNNSTNG